MDTPSAIALISEVEVKEVKVRLSLSGVEAGTPILECLWPKVTFSCNGVERVYPFTYWRTLKDSGTQQENKGSMFGGPGGGGVRRIDYTLVDIAFLAAGLRPTTRPYVLADAAEAKGRLLYKQIYKRLVSAAKKQSFIDRHTTLMRKFERAEGKKKLRDLLLTLPHRLEKRDVIEAWQEAVVTRVMES